MARGSSGDPPVVLDVDRSAIFFRAINQQLDVVAMSSSESKTILTDGVRSLCSAYLADSSNGHALRFQLSDPRLDARLRELRLVVLIARQADELAVSFRFRLGMVVAFGGREADNLSTLLFKTMLELIHGIAEIVRVARLVPEAEDRNFFAGKIQRCERAVQKVVPACPASLSICIRVPCGRTADEGIRC